VRSPSSGRWVRRIASPSARGPGRLGWPGEPGRRPRSKGSMSRPTSGPDGSGLKLDWSTADGQGARSRRGAHGGDPGADRAAGAGTASGGRLVPRDVALGGRAPRRGAAPWLLRRSPRDDLDPLPASGSIASAPRSSGCITRETISDSGSARPPRPPSIPHGRSSWDRRARPGCRRSFRRAPGRRPRRSRDPSAMRCSAAWSRPDSSSRTSR